MKKIVLGTAIAGLMLSTALAQAPSTPDTSSPSPSATSPSTTSPSKMSPSSSTAAPGTMTFVSTQQPDQLLASKFKGTNVVGADNVKIGDVSDMLFDKD